MGIITTMRRQKACYWAPKTNPAGDYILDTQAQIQYDAAVEIDCRWEDTAEWFTDAQGDRRLSSAKVYVDRDVLVNGFLKLGALTSSIVAFDPRENSGILEIRRFDKTPNLRNTEVLRTVML